jgi:hypothetical protein
MIFATINNVAVWLTMKLVGDRFQPLILSDIEREHLEELHEVLTELLHEKEYGG